MPKLKVLSGRAVRAILEEQGFVFIRQRGSHMVMSRTVEGHTTTVIVPDHTEVARGTLRGIIAQAGLTRSLFETQ